MIIDKSEKEDFNNAILSSGLDPTDFELTEREEPMHGTGVQPIIGQVKVRRKSTGAHKIYRAGHMSHWAADFVDDLKHGVFD
jgi:hypothetical protein